MRTSVSSLAVIRESSGGADRYLGQWNPAWAAFAFVGGHREADETARQCLVREVAEELRVAPLAADPDAWVTAKEGVEPAVNGDGAYCTVSAEPVGVLEYEAFSQSAGVRTRYEVSLYEVSLSPVAVPLAEANPENRWLSEEDIERGRCADGKAVSDTVQRHVAWLRRNRPAVAPVYWLQEAQTSLQAAMARQLGGAADDAPMWEEQARVGEWLRAVFPAAWGIVIKARFEGFKAKVRPHKLLVEVVTPPAPGEARGQAAPGAGVFNGREVHFVKVGTKADDPDGLGDELAGWLRCRPAGADSVLSSLAGVRDAAGRVVGLVYRDADSALGGANVSSFEQAFRDCVAFGSPTVESVANTLWELYGRLDQRFYRRSFVPPRDCHLALAKDLSKSPVRLSDRLRPDGLSATVFRNKIERALALFEEQHSPAASLGDEDRRRMRREALSQFPTTAAPDFVDPHDFMRGILDAPERTPDLLVGLAHGDLHGRNVIVSRVDSRLTAAALFDYSDLRLNNHVAWDFVELETETKIRAYGSLFREDPPKFVREVARLERALNTWTETFHHTGKIPEPDAAWPADVRRLARIILELRKAAKWCLGEQRLRANRWLEEYYFMLAAYGVSASWFDNYGGTELLAGYVSAGVAAARVSRVCRELPVQITEARAAATAVLNDPNAVTETVAQLVDRVKQTRPWADADAIGHHARFTFAKRWVEANVHAQRPFVEAGIMLLEDLRKTRFPHVLELAEAEMVGLLELGHAAAVQDRLNELTRRHVFLSMEVFGRQGRVQKMRGEEAWPDDVAAMPPEARREFELALATYQSAWDRDGNYYPGINVAALLHLLGRSADGAAVAQRVLELATPFAVTDLWAALTRADALFLLNRHAEAKDQYQAAADRGTHQNLASAGRQVRLLLRVAPATVRAEWPEEALTALFGGG